MRRRAGGRRQRRAWWTARGSGTADRSAREPECVLPLDTVRRRLELFVSALHERPLRIEAAPTPPPLTLAGRARGAFRHLLARAASDTRTGSAGAGAAARSPGAFAAGAFAANTFAAGAFATVDGEVVRLPPTLPALDGTDAALARYRAMALGLAERVRRNTARHAPVMPAGRGNDRARLTRDLYHLAESAAAEHAAAVAVRGLGPVIVATRTAALARRPALDALAPAERAVEQLVRRVLAAAPEDEIASGDSPADATGAEGVPCTADPRDSRAWAEQMAERLHQELRARHRGRFRYRGVTPVEAWGAPATGSVGAASPLAVADDEGDALQHRATLPVGGTRARAASAGEQDDGTGLAATGGTGAEHTPRPEVADARAPARVMHDPGAGRLPGEQHPSVDARDTEATAGGAAMHRLDAPMTPPIGPAGVRYPEWDAVAGRYRPRHATVRESPAPEADPAWAEAVLRAQAPLVRRVRERFEPLRARRTRLGAQRRGDEIDLAACVRAAVDRYAGRAPSDRLYVDVRPARRPIATLLLVDVSGSTDLAIDATRQIIDVEREAMLLAATALDALGDPYEVLTFASRGADDVRVRVVKRFGERNGDIVRRRVSGVHPDGNTRLGAALRHATARLARQPAGHRLLLLLSDGQPNDRDGYQGRAAIEDARRAVLEARAAGVVPFCLTVDREVPETAAQVFGVGAFTVLRDPAHLPRALVRVVEHLLGG